MLAAGAIAACGSSSPSDNGVAAKSATDILTSTSTALKNAKSVHLSGSLSSSGQSIKLDLSILAGKGAKGTMTLNGASLQLIVAGSSVYINAGSKFWQQHGGAQVAQLLQGRWFKTPATSGSFASFSSFTDLRQLAQSLGSGHGTLSKGSTTTINGQKAIAIKDSGQGGQLYVATTGKPYPLEVAKAGSGSQHLDFDRYGASVTLLPPAKSIDISQLKSK